MGSIFGDSPDPIPAPDYSRMDPLVNGLYAQVNNDRPWMQGQETPGQAQFRYAANRGVQNVMNAQAAQKGVRASQMATMGNNTQANMQSDINAQAAVRDAMEREAAQNQLASIFLNQEGQKIGVNQQNQQNQQNAMNAQDRMLGMGLTAAGYAFGGPAGGMAANQATSGMGAPTNMGTNPYAGPAPVSGGGAYDPSRYNMGRGLQFNGGF